MTYEYHEDLSRDLTGPGGQHPRRCMMCGAPTRLGRDRCLRHTIWPWQTTEGLPPLEHPRYRSDLDGVPPLSGADLDAPIEEPPALTSRADDQADMRAHAQSRWDWVARWAHIAGDLDAGIVRPSTFPLDRRCRLCVAILNENFSEAYFTPTSVGFRCARHETLRGLNAQETTA